MTVARSAAEVLAEHVTLEVECIDRMYLNVYVPKLQYVGGVVSFLRKHRGNPIASSALLDPISRAFVGALHTFAADQGVPVIDFAKGQRKDDVAQEYLAALSQLTGLTFQKSTIESHSLDRLAALQSLRSLRFVDMPVSRKEMLDLQEQLPVCEVAALANHPLMR